MNAMLIKRNSKIFAVLLEPGFPVVPNHLHSPVRGLKSCRFHDPQIADVGLEIPIMPFADLGSPFQSCFADHLKKMCFKTPGSALDNDLSGVCS